MAASTDDVVHKLQTEGFRITYRSSAIALLAHPGRPGLAIRVGSRDIVLEHGGQERYRSSLAGFDLQKVLSLARQFGSQPKDDV